MAFKNKLPILLVGLAYAVAESYLQKYWIMKTSVNDHLSHTSEVNIRLQIYNKISVNKIAL